MVETEDINTVSAISIFSGFVLFGVAFIFHLWPPAVLGAVFCAYGSSLLYLKWRFNRVE